METSLDCFVNVSAQDSASKTYVDIDGTLLVNQTGVFFGKTIDGSLTVTRNIVDACLNTTQSIRMTISIDGEDVTDSLIGTLTIAHNKNYISTFSFQLGDPKYSPLTDSHIAINAEVIIIIFINGQEMRLFTGLVDSTITNYGNGYALSIEGRGYGKKLLEKNMTLISVDQSASRQYRGSMVEFIAEQGEITNIDIPIGDAVGIDHSFQDQSLWDMIQKECAIEGWYVRFDENGKMIVKTTNKKTTADWEYGEDKFEELGLETTDKGIINKVTILGAIYEEEVVTVSSGDEIDIPDEEEDIVTHTISKSFSLGETVEAYSHTDSNFKVVTRYLGLTHIIGSPLSYYLDYAFDLTLLNSDYVIQSVDWTISGDATRYNNRRDYCYIHRETFNGIQGAFTITITIKTREVTGGGDNYIDDNLPNETTSSEIIYHQVKATVSDENSIDTYGERKPNNEGTLEFPLAETEAQCERIGENVILEGHRFIKQPDYLVPFNPKIVVGCTVKITSETLGYDEEWVVEEVVHAINIDKNGKIKARTRIGCVYYA